MAALNTKLGFSAGAFKFHIEDKKSDHACPGKLARCERAALVAEIEATMSGHSEPAADIPVGMVGDEEADKQAHMAIPAADPPKDKAGVVASMLDTSDRNFSILKRLSDQGSRVAGTVRAAKTWFWGLLGGGGAASQLVDTNKGVGQIFADWIAAHPFLFVGFCLTIILAAVYFLVLKRGEKFLVTAFKDGRYQPRGSQ